MARFGAERTLWFDAEQDGSYTARYGAKDTLVHDSQNHLFILTRQDGSRCEFFDYEQTAHPQGGLYRWVQASGATVEVIAWTTVGVHWYARPCVAEVLDKTTPSGQAHQKRVFTYISAEDPHVETVTLLSYDEGTTSWVNVRKMTYAYYGYGESYGLPGDLKTIVTEAWDAVAEEWVGDDTNYFRYYPMTGPQVSRAPGGDG
ncbi:MAG: hypothetical protein HUU20_16370 [Pirellulales bacterium]|nr:hypothetical protein [Pirellulales bacterium]